MTCETARKLLPLRAYDELTFDQEEALEQHLEACAECRAAAEEQTRFTALLDRGAAPVPGELLPRCRQDLQAALERERRRPGLAARLRAACQAALNPPLWLRPAGALAMLAAGFALAQWQPAQSLVARARGNDLPRVERVRYLEPDGLGRVRVAYEETHPRVTMGEMDDVAIRRLLLTAASDPNDASLRVESIELLGQRSADDDVRRALLNALATDANAGVRLKALEGLRPYARDAATRKVLTRVLLADGNAAIRAQAIDMLVQNKGPEVAGVLQEVLRAEGDAYVRSRSQKALAEMKASLGTF